MAATNPERLALGAVLSVYQRSGEVSNDALYEAVKAPLGFTDADYEQRAAVGKAGTKHCLAHRAVRWHVQTLKKLKLVERVPNRRGVWRFRGGQEKELTPAAAGMTLVGFSTALGVALWSSCDVFSKINEPVALCLTSPPYALAKPRRYGNPSEKEIVDFIVRALEPIVKNLVPGGSLILNTSNDIFIAGSPARSLYTERLVLALNEKLGLFKMDTLIWRNPTKPPGPMAWASNTRQQLNVEYELLLWMTNDPLRCFSDNRRVLLPHTDRHRKLVAGGGEQRNAVNSDGAYRIRAGKSYAAETPGRIPRNILEFTHHGAEITETRKRARALGLPIHGALMPLALAVFLVKFLTREGDLVADPFGGWGSTAVAAEQTGRRWITTERMAEYVAGHALRLADAVGFRSSIPWNPEPGLDFF